MWFFGEPATEPPLRIAQQACAPIPQGLGKVRGADVTQTRKIGNRAGHAQYARMPSTAQAEPGDRTAQELAAFRIETTMKSHLLGAQARIARRSDGFRTLPLALSGAGNPFANLVGRFAQRRVHELVRCEPRHIDEQIDPVEERA
jgi:hypothetical protein